MDNFWSIVGGGIAVFLFFSGVAFFYWVVSKCDREEEKEGANE